MHTVREVVRGKREGKDLPFMILLGEKVGSGYEMWWFAIKKKNGFDFLKPSL